MGYRFESVIRRGEAVAARKSQDNHKLEIAYATTWRTK